MNLKTGICSGVYIHRYGLSQGLSRMKSHGYDCLDYSDFVNTNSDLFKMNDNEFEHSLLSQKQATKDAGIEICQTHGPWRYPPHDYSVEQREERFEKMKKSIRGTSILGCKYIVIHPIMPFGDIQDPEPERLWDMNYEFMTRLCDVGREYNVVVCLENMPMKRLSLSRPVEILKFVKTMNTEWMRICLDTGHCSVFGESPADAVRLFGKEYLSVLHVHDNNGQADQHLKPYFGIIDWADFSKSLHEINFCGTLSLETKFPANIPAQLREYYEIGLYRIAKNIAEY